jgi:hypothetical protein
MPSITISESLAIRLMTLLPEEDVAMIASALMAEQHGLSADHSDELAMLASHMHVARRLRERAANDPERDRGLYEKYVVQRADGATGDGRKHEHCRHFVLDVDHDPLAAPCLNLYADLCETSYPRLARDLRKLTGSMP